jgi:hypothetical protein
MEHFWEPHETNTHQDHVIAHVVGATIVGHFSANETAYLLLDIGFIWIIYLDGEMGLVPQSMAIAELDADELVKTELREDLQVIEFENASSGALKRFKSAPDECLITEVELHTRPDERRIAIKCEGANLVVDTSLATREICIYSES